MTPGPPGGRRLFVRVLLLVALPLLVWAVFALGAWRTRDATPPPPERRLAATASALQETFRSLLDAAMAVATDAIEASPMAARDRARQGVWGGRLEGIAVLDRAGGPTDWCGRPAEPPVGSELERRWSIRSEGLRTRLVVTTGSDESGRHGIASFVLDTPLEDLPFDHLLPRARFGGAAPEVEWLDSKRSHEDVEEFFGSRDSVLGEGEPATRWVALRASDGSLLGVGRVLERPRERRAAWLRAAGNAAAALAFVALLAFLVPWKAVCRTRTGLVVTLAAITGGRLALVATRLPANLLPRELGSPSLYGSSRLFGLIASPADFLLTASALFLLALALGLHLVATETRRRVTAAVLAAVGVAVLTVALAVLSISLGADSRLAPDLFETSAAPAAQATLLSGLVLMLLGAAGLAVRFWGAAVRPGLVSWPSALQLGTALLPLAAVSSTAFQVTADRIARERLDPEFAAQVLEQSARRSVALVAAVRKAAEDERSWEAALAPEDHDDAYAAYRLWVSGELFHLGFKSSLDLYDADGQPIGHFGFDLPALAETVDPAALPVEDPAVLEEVFDPALAREQRLLHAALPIVDNGTVVGAVVGHVLDEPDNLPFLPSLRPYLAALGPGVPEDPEEAPEYVLYDRGGNVVVSTLPDPPAARILLEPRTSSDAETIRVAAGGQPMVGLALRTGGQLHLLLLRDRPLLDRLAVFAKLFLLAAAAMGVAVLLRAAVPFRGPGFLVRGLRESFQNKLLAALLLASLVPLVGLAAFLGGYFERRADDELAEVASQVIGVVQRLVRDYAAVQQEETSDGGVELSDELLYWLRRVVGQEIHLYEDGRLAASSKRELFTSGLLPPSLAGEARRRILDEGLPYTVLRTRLGQSTIPEAYGRLDLPKTDRQVVAAVPMILQQREIARWAERVEEMLVLTTVLLALLVIGVTSLAARTVARPVRDLVEATGRITAGDYSARLEPRSRDEIAELVEKFNAMAAALARQRADLEARRDYMQALLTHATTGVISTDAEGRIVTSNPAATRLLAPQRESLPAGSHLPDLVGERPELEPLVRSLTDPRLPSGEPVEVDLTRRDEPLRLRLVKVPLPDPTGGASGSLILLDDVTDLMRSNQLAAWAEMARAIAHEIKNPLTPIQLSTEHLEKLLRDRSVLPSRELESCLETVMNQVRELRHIAAEFSAYAKLPSLALEPTDAAALMRQVIRPYRAAPPDGITIEERYSSSPRVLADRRVLSRALVNLVENAIQAMNDGGTLTLRVEPTEDGRGTILCVEDSGPGLSAEVRARLFEPYFSTKSSGTGLGLAIVRRAVEALGGAIEVDSEPGRGTRFRIRLPAETAQGAAQNSV